MSTATLTRALRPLTADEISERLLAFRKAKQGLTQKALAAAVGTSQANIQRWETGTEIPGSMIEPLCAVLGIDSDDLLFETDVPQLPKPARRGKKADE